MTIFQELKRRGLIAQTSREEEIEALFEKERVKFYVGFDATADSLHIGGLLQLITMRRLQRAGHYPIALLGTATTVIGDPTGKTDMRKMLDDGQIAHNAECFKEQMSRFIEFGEGKAEIVRNGDWFADMKYLEFLRDIGRHFSVNKMLTAECFKSRFEGKGLSFLEFNYMLLQSYDFLHLYRTKGVRLQLGGDDQWSNVLAGADLIRRVEQGEAFAMTFALITTKDGKKMGKTEKGALWLDAEKCPPYDFFQYFRNVDDAEVVKLMKMLTFIPVGEIEEMEKTLSGAEFNAAKERLAFEVTALVHGEGEAAKARDAAKSVFGAGRANDNMPTVTLAESDFSDGKIAVLDLLVKAGLCASKREARTTVEQGAASVNRVKVTDVNALIEIDGYAEVQKGKKNFVKAVRGRG
ncbi:MAG: tyrosine--tRNA ligase [Oscillospiraceae bacterium]|jgi:tyrosyl-tRNA synthetase|nr:tyrosine--tRNA ligase [Oscillospiraceae bacterium]